MDNENNDKKKPIDTDRASVPEAEVIDGKLILYFDTEQPPRSQNDRNLSVIEFLIEQNQLDRSESEFHQSMRTQLLDKGFLSQTQREYILKAIGHLIGVKHYVPIKPSKGGT